MLKTQVFFCRTPKKSNMFPYINRVTRHPQRPGSLSVFIRMPWQPPGAKPPDQSGSVRGLVKTRTQGRAIGTSAACSPAWLIIQSTTASFTGCAALHADRGGPQNGPRRMLHVRTASASIALSTARAPLPSDPNAPLSPSNAPIRPNAPRYHPLPPGKAQSTSWYQQLTRTYIAPKPSIMRNKG